MTKSSENVRRMVLCAMFTALVAVCSQIAVPMPWGVPINLALFAVYMAGTMLGPVWGTASQVVFIALAAIGVPVSSWLYLTVAFFSLYMGFGKRRGDARSASAATVYTPVFLERAMQLCLTLALVFYSLWSAGAGLAGSRMLWTVPLAVCICLKYAGDLDAGAEGDPVELLLHDRVLLLLSLAFTVLVLLLLYL